MNFEQWLQAVDDILHSKLGLSVHDLADFNSYDLFQSGATPEEGAAEALENDDGFQFFMEEDAYELLGI